MEEKRSIGMLVAVEIDSIFARYGTPGKTEKRGGFDIYRFENEEYVLHVIHSGIGELAAAAATELLIDRFGAELVVNFGVAGGLTEAAAQSALCVVTKIVHYDFDLSGIDPVKPAQYPGYEDIFIPAEEALVKKALSRCPQLQPVICASADKFVGNRADKERLHKLYGADICEMESAAVLLTCRRSGIPSLIIKAVSDGLTGGGKEYYEALQECADLALSVTDRVIRGL